MDINEFPLCITLQNIFENGESSIGNLIETSPTAIQVHLILISDYTIEDEEMEEQPESIIKDPLHRDVEEGRLYWDKNTISSVMKHYAIPERFQFKVKRSSSSRYKLYNYFILPVSTMYKFYILLECWYKFA